MPAFTSRKTQTLQGAELPALPAPAKTSNFVSHLSFQCKAVQETSLAVAQVLHYFVVVGAAASLRCLVWLYMV